MNRKQTIQRVTLVGAMVNLLFAIFKIVFGAISHSHALLADGVHSLSDLVTDVFVIIIAKYATDAPDEEHPYGHARLETIATLGLAVILALVGIGVIYDASINILNPVVYDYPLAIIIIVSLSIIGKEALYWYTLKAGKKINSELLRANAWHHRSDAVSSIVVLLGIVFTLFDFVYLDSIAAIIVGVMIILIGFNIGKKAVNELIDTGLDKETIIKIKQQVNTIAGVRDIHLLKTRMHGHLVIVDVHIQVDPFLSVSEGHNIAVNVEQIIQKTLDSGSDVMVHIDPENDENIVFGITLPNYQEAVEIINKELKKNNCYTTKKVRLHYLNAQIHIDFYLELSCLETSSKEALKSKFKMALSDYDYWGNFELYFY
jgi:cation diffusion facilitator family transporter